MIYLDELREQVRQDMEAILSGIMYQAPQALGRFQPTSQGVGDPC